MKQASAIIITFAIFCSFLLPSNLLAANELDQDLKNYIEATAYRKGSSICYAFLYHFSHPARSDIRAWTASLQSTDVELREGSREWLLFITRSFMGKGLSLSFLGILPPTLNILGILPSSMQNQDPHKDILALTTMYAQYLVDTTDFRNGVMDCAKAHNSTNPEGFADFMKRAVLGSDQAGGMVGTVAGLTLDGFIGSYLIKGIQAGWFSFSQTRFTKWIANTKVASVLSNRIAFVMRHKWKFAGATITGFASIAGGYYYKIYKDNKTRRETARTGLIAYTSNSRQQVINNRWSMRQGMYQNAILNKMEQLEQLTAGTLEHIRLDAEISILIDHYAKDYIEIRDFVEEYRELTTQTNLTGALQEQYLFFSGMLELFEMRKQDLEDELLDLENGGTARVVMEGYDRYGHLKVLFDLMELESGDTRLGSRTGLNRNQLVDYNLEYKSWRLEQINI